MPVRKSIREFVETATEVLEPSESDVRAVQPDPVEVAGRGEPIPAPPHLTPAEHVHPDAKELEREHRGD